MQYAMLKTRYILSIKLDRSTAIIDPQVPPTIARVTTAVKAAILNVSVAASNLTN
jgi:hypothetical protein